MVTPKRPSRSGFVWVMWILLLASPSFPVAPSLSLSLPLPCLGCKVGFVLRALPLASFSLEVVQDCEESSAFT